MSTTLPSTASVAPIAAVSAQRLPAFRGTASRPDADLAPNANPRTNPHRNKWHFSLYHLKFPYQFKMLRTWFYDIF
jgi:hypothetical protein